MATAVIDVNVLVGLLDERDKWHGTAVAIRDALDEADAELIYFDCVLNEEISVDYLLYKSRQEDVLWSKLSLTSALKGLEDEEWPECDR
jgi:predicted nucleic acid-binding protein